MTSQPDEDLYPSARDALTERLGKRFELGEALGGQGLGAPPLRDIISLKGQAA